MPPRYALAYKNKDGQVETIPFSFDMENAVVQGRFNAQHSIDLAAKANQDHLDATATATATRERQPLSNIRQPRLAQ